MHRLPATYLQTIAIVFSMFSKKPDGDIPCWAGKIPDIPCLARKRTVYRGLYHTPGFTTPLAQDYPDPSLYPRMDVANCTAHCIPLLRSLQLLLHYQPLHPPTSSLQSDRDSQQLGGDIACLV